jgi:V-type H+-transporting ATPase subunit H
LEELGYIKKVDRQPRAKVEALHLSEGRAYTLLYLSLLKKLNRVDTMQCLLVLIADALQGKSHLRFQAMSFNKVSDHEERIPLFFRAAEADPDLPYVPLLRYIFICP